MQAVPVAPMNGKSTDSVASAARGSLGFAAKAMLSARMPARKKTRGFTTRNSGSALRRPNT